MEKLSCALGMSMASSLLRSGIKNLDIDTFVTAFAGVINNQPPTMSFQEADKVIQAFLTERQSAMLAENKENGKAFLEENKKRENVVTLPSGLQYEIITEGNGPKPSATSRVKTHYHGSLIDGTVFDSSVERGQPAVFGVNQVIRGWTEALQLMSVGSKWKLFIPSELAYGEQGAGQSIAPNSALIFEVELLGIE